MKVIDLLIKIANGEEIPKKIKHNSTLYHFNREYMDYESDIQEYRSADVKEHYYLFTEWCPMILNDEVEIIEEDKEIEFEHIEEYFVPQEFLRDGSGRTKPDKNSKEYKINQLIINQRKLINIVNELKKGK